MRNWFRGLAAASALAAAAQALAANNQIVVSFDDLPVGTGDISFDAFDDPGFGNNIFGGVVTPATPADPAVSGTQVYRGTAIGFFLDDAVQYAWPAVGAFVTGSAPITLTVKTYDHDQNIEVVVFTGSVPGGTQNIYLGVGDDANPGDFTSALFESTAPFSIDDLTLGLVDVLPGIPEPQTWLLLTCGFAVTGAALRRCRVGTPAIA